MRTAKSCGSDASKLASSSREASFLGATVTRKPDHREEHVISRKAIAQGMSDCLRCPVCSCAHFFVHMHTRPPVQRASGIPCALYFLRAKNTGKPRADRAARTTMRIHGLGKEPARNPEQTSSMAVVRRRRPASISPCFQGEVFTQVRYFSANMNPRAADS